MHQQRTTAPPCPKERAYRDALARADAAPEFRAYLQAVSDAAQAREAWIESWPRW